ncbi:MAG: GNAT family N-acetyltransferase [Methanosarcinales archaeon]
MNKVSIIDELQLIELAEDDDLSAFNSSSEDLNDFLKKDAWIYQKNLMGKTFLCKYKENIVAYITLLTDSIKVKEIQNEDKEEKVHISYYPAVKIGRLAVDQRFEHQGIGTFLLKTAIGNAIELSKYAACRFVILDAKRESIEFYKKQYFKLIKKHEKKRYPTMYFDLLPVYEEIKKR